MDRNQELLIELDLFEAIGVFHECDDKEERERNIKEYTLTFCKKYNIDPFEAIDKLTDYFKAKREQTPFKYGHYRDNELKRIIFPPQAKNSTNSDDIEIGD